MYKECPLCGGHMEYLKYIVRVGGSDSLHAYKCLQCECKQFYVAGPSRLNVEHEEDTDE